MKTTDVYCTNEYLEEIELVDRDDIISGDVILVNGLFKTINQEFIKYDDFLGTTLFGDSYNLGTKKVKRLILKEIK